MLFDMPQTAFWQLYFEPVRRFVHFLLGGRAFALFGERLLLGKGVAIRLYSLERILVLDEIEVFNLLVQVQDLLILLLPGVPQLHPLLEERGVVHKEDGGSFLAELLVVVDAELAWKVRKVVGFGVLQIGIGPRTSLEVH